MMNAALVVGYIALKRENRDLIREEGGMEPLCKILNNEYYREELHDAAATAMANLSKNNYMNRTRIRKHGGLDRFVAYYRERQIFPPPGWATDYIPC